MFPLDEPVWRCPISSTLWASCSHPIIGISPEGLEGGLEDPCLCCAELSLMSGITLGVWSPPPVELYALLTSTSGELTQVLLLWQSQNDQLGEWSLFLQRAGKGLKEWAPHGRGALKRKIQQKRYGRRNFSWVSRTAWEPWSKWFLQLRYTCKS